MPAGGRAWRLRQQEQPVCELVHEEAARWVAVWEQLPWGSAGSAL